MADRPPPPPAGSPPRLPRRSPMMATLSPPPPPARLSHGLDESPLRSPGRRPRAGSWRAPPPEAPEPLPRTKIVCAIGPACRDVEGLLALIDGGMSVARFNFSHGTHEQHAQSLANLRDAMALRPERTVAVLLDLMGPEVRTGRLANGGEPLSLPRGHRMVLDGGDWALEGSPARVAVSHPRLAAVAAPGARILVADGELEFEVLGAEGEGEAAVQVRLCEAGVLGEHKNVNVGGVEDLGLDPVSAKDRADLQFAVEHGVDIVSCSLARSGAHVRAVRQCLRAAGPGGARVRVHAKVESLAAVRALDELLVEADAVHVSRGDLGMAIGVHKVHRVQKLVIARACAAGKPVVTSTQMLDSMRRCSAPTAAECADVANAVVDGTHAVMLSGETASGAFPADAVRAMATICRLAEESLDRALLFARAVEAAPAPLSTPEAVARAAVQTAFDVGAPLIVVLTETGHTACLVAKYRPAARVVAVTASRAVAVWLAGVVRDVLVHVVQTMRHTDAVVDLAIGAACAAGLAGARDSVVAVHGLQAMVSGASNMVRVLPAVGVGGA